MLIAKLPRMRAGWQKFWRKPTIDEGGARDMGVAPHRAAAAAWLIRAVLVVSTLALLGTSQNVEPSAGASEATYRFQRTVEGDPVDLTRELPTGSFLVTIRALDLGPEDVRSTDEAHVTVTATVTISDIATDPPAATLLLSGNARETFRESVSSAHTLTFGGTCDKPAPDAPCQATFDVTFGREDDGLQDGTVHIDWSFELTSSGKVPAKEATLHPDRDPPWTVEIAPQ